MVFRLVQDSGYKCAKDKFIMDRKQSMAVYNSLYTKEYPLIEDEVCQCCGVTSDLQIDHCPAITTAHLYVSNNDIPFIKILLCGECNRIASNRLLPRFTERFFTIKEKLLERHVKDLVNEFRTEMDYSEESLLKADKQFQQMLDRVGFGLLRVDLLSQEHQRILQLTTISGETIYSHLAHRSGGALLTPDEMAVTVIDSEISIEAEDANDEVIDAEYLTEVLIDNEITSYQEYIDFYHGIPTRAFALDLPETIKEGVIEWSKINHAIHSKTEEPLEFYEDILDFVTKNNIRNEKEYLLFRRELRQVDRESLPLNISDYHIDWDQPSKLLKRTFFKLKPRFNL
jgi:hypothetical protein